MTQTKDILHQKSGSASSAGVGKTTGNFASIISGSGTTFTSHSTLKEITAGFILVGSKDPGGGTSVYFKIIDIC